MREDIEDVGAFYRRHAPAVYRFALYLCRERSDAEDITADTFVRVWLSSAPIREATVTEYLFTIARNLHRELHRKERRHVALDDSERDQRPDPLARASSDSDRAALFARLTRLSDDDRAALMMRAVEGMPYTQIANVLGISIAAARVRVHRARLALADIR